MAPRRNGRALAVATTPVRCAVYTRKSTDEGLDKDFNTLDAQRELAEAYITSQRHEGWTLVPDRYDDGGYTGANTNRPALNQLLSDITAGKTDCVVVYRYDRVSRNLLDFLQLMEFLKKHGVAFVSVSERFDTSTPHGEMALNMVLSVAQCERKVIGQRTRDKVCAARRRGKWTGGIPPLGYDVAPEGGKLVVNKDEAALVPQIFELYTERPSLVDVSLELNRRGWRRKSWTTKDGKHRKAKPWAGRTLANLLRDPTYIGMLKLCGETFKGEHKGIVPRALFEKVQRLLDRNLRDRGSSARNKHGALLRGLLRCSACDAAMTFAPARRGNRFHRYYRCQAANRNGHGSCPTKCVRADDLEQFVVDQIRRIGADPALQDETFRQAVAQVKAQRRGLKLDQRNLKKELDRAKADVTRLTETLSRTHGPAADAVAAELGRAQEQVTHLESRKKGIKAGLAELDAQVVERADLARALEAFDPIWDVLLIVEKERVLRLLIEKIDYNGGNGKLEITWRLGGFGQLAKELV